MYISARMPRRIVRDVPRNLSGMGIWETIIPAAIGAFAGDSSGGSAGFPPGGASAPSSPITVSPTIQTSISPQISPVFQQQFQPTNSAATAGTAQTAPTSQIAPGQAPTMPGTASGYTPGFPSGAGTAFPSPLEAGIFQSGTDSPLAKYGPLVLIVGAGAIAFMMRSKRSERT